MKNRKVYSKRKNNGHNNGFTPSNGLFKVTIKNDEQVNGQMKSLDESIEFN